uniref:Uncharacterized protein n=1 Tax=Arundo donax TaxID=35708 RepID=A0A0A9HHH7_ARUDO
MDGRREFSGAGGRESHEVGI